MANSYVRIAAHAVGFLTATLAVLALQSIPVLGQGKTPVPSSDSARTRMTSDDQREAQMESLGAAPASKVDQKRLAAAQAQIQQDFVQILTLHNQIANITTGQAPIDYHFVSDASADIRKRAGRLQQTLLLAKAAGAQQTHPKKVKYEDAQIKQALVALCQQIKAFVTNPVIENPGTVDPMQLSKASDDLSGIIELSGSIKKSADRLTKASQ
jgi:hypothetical protein